MTQKPKMAYSKSNANAVYDMDAKSEDTPN
jgi:hypothetical protein